MDSKARARVIPLHPNSTGHPAPSPACRDAVVEEHRQPRKPTGELTLPEILAIPAPRKGRKRVKLGGERGFFMLITANDARSYYIETSVRGRGKQRKVCLGGVRPQDEQHITLSEARQQAKLVKSQAHSMDKDGKGIDISRAVTNTAGLTLQQAYDLYKADQINPKRKRPWADSTLDKYETMIERLANWRGRGLFSITQEEVRIRCEQVIEKYGSCEASQTFRNFRAMWNFHASELDPPPGCPTRVLNAEKKDLWYRKDDDERRIIEDKDFPFWWRSMDGIGAHVGNASAWALYFRMQPTLGLRRKETLLLEWTWWDKDARVLTLPKHATKPRRRLKIPVGRRMAAMIEAHRKTQTPGTLFVFASRAGRRLTHPGNVIARHRKKHGNQIPNWSPHDNRRVYASAVHALRPPDKVLPMLLNHSVKGDVTMLYVQLRDELHHYQQLVEDVIFKRAKVR